MRIVHVTGSVGLDGAGVREFVLKLAHEQLASGHDVKVYGYPINKSETVEWGDIQLVLLPILGPRKLAYQPRLIFDLFGSDIDIIHVHGLWTLQGIAAKIWAKLRARPYIVSVHGMLSNDALAINRGLKRVAEIAYQRGVLQSANAIHVTSKKEEHDLRMLFHSLESIAFVPPGVDIHENLKQLERREKIILSIGRLHPIKSLDVLIEAWSRMHHRFREWQLCIYGPGDREFRDQLKEMCRQLGVDRVSINDAIYGNQKLAAMREASLFVVPSKSENFALTIAEALSVGTPVIASQGTPWSELCNRSCGWWIPYGVEPLIDTLESAMNLPVSERGKMGVRGHNWMKADFQWKNTSDRFEELYEWVLRKRQKPPFVC